MICNTLYTCSCNDVVNVCDSSRFGFVTFDDIATAKKMLNKHNGTEVDGCVIDMRFAEDRRSSGGGGGGGRGWGRGGGGGGFRGRGGGRGETLSLSLCWKVVEGGVDSEQLLKTGGPSRSSEVNEFLSMMTMTER